uniref:Zinc finger, CCHC-type n=1 Tax=Tanacetum cinerariifolium TaxID=118510 RepID=A0A699GVA6_TANCI|nr:zinc finger, CCHC-type [Tanacetum cinerariifolium]
MVGFKMDYFKGMSYDYICPIFEKYFNSNVAFLEKIKEHMEEEENKALKKTESSKEKVVKKQKLDEEVEELKKHQQIVPNNDDNVYTEATPLAFKVPIIYFEIYTENNKPYFKIIRADGTHQLFLSFLSLLRNFDREDLEGESVNDMKSKFDKLVKFEGQNFRWWQKNMHFLLTTLKVVYILSTASPVWSENETLETTRKRMKGENDEYICRGHILNGMSNSLFDIYQNDESSKAFWESLESKYTAEDASATKFLVSSFMNYKMVDTSPIMEQYHEMLRILGQYTQHSLMMDKAILVVVIIDKLSPSWNEFKHGLKHKKEELNLVQLNSHLQIEEGLRNQELDNNPKGKTKLDHLLSTWLKEMEPKIPTTIRTKESSKVVTINLPTRRDDEVAWWVDSGATSHVSRDLYWFQVCKSIEEGSFVKMGNVATKPIKGIGCVLLNFTSVKTLCLDNVLYVPRIQKNLVSKIVLNKCGYKQVLESDKYILSRHGSFVGFGYVCNGMNRLILNYPLFNASACMITSSNSNSLSKSELWHARLGHVHYKRMRDMSKVSLIPAFNMTHESCKTCMLTKITRQPFKGVNWESRVLDLIHSDLCDFHANPSLGHNKFYVIEPNDYVLVNSIIKSRDAIFDEEWFTYISRPRGMIQPSFCKIVEDEVEGTDDVPGPSVPRKSTRTRKAKSFGSDFQLYLVEGTRDKTLSQPLAAIDDLVIHQIDVKTTFLNGDLDEEIYMKQPRGFMMPRHESKVCKLKKSLYGLKQAPKQWHQKFDDVVLSNHFSLNQADKCVYSKFDASGKGVIICLYVDDMLIFVTEQNQVNKTKEFFSSKFDMKDLGEAELEYFKAIGYLMYAMISTRLAIAFAVGKLSRYTSNPSALHWQDLGFSDVSWINNMEDHSSMSGWVFFLRRGAISWALKKQTCITSSTIESEFMALAAASNEAQWLRNLVYEIPLWPKPISTISIRCDSAATLAKAYSQVYNGKSRHLGVIHSMIRELIMNGVISVEFVKTQLNLADFCDHKFLIKIEVSVIMTNGESVNDMTSKFDKLKFQGTCYNCDQPGHRVANYKMPKRLNLRQDNMVNDNMDMIAMVSDVIAMISEVELAVDNGEKLYMGNSATADLKGQRDVILKMRSEKELKLTNVLYGCSQESCVWRYAMNGMFKLNVIVVKNDFNKVNSSAYLIESSNVWHGRLRHVCYVYLLKSKDEAIDKFILYKTKVKNQLGRKIKVVRSDRGENKPTSYREAVTSSEGQQWKEAIKSEIDSILQNHTWELIDLSPGCKTLGYKWILKKKMKANGTIDKYKARLIIKGFRQEGLDYFDTYSPITRIASIRMILAIAALRNLEVHQMYVNTAFLNSDLEEEIYMNQPEGFIALGQ